MSFGRISLADLQPIWRIVAAVIIFQLIGGGVGWAVAPHHFPFLNVWLGAGMATPIGFFVGLWVHLADPDRREGTPRPLTTFLGVIALILGGAAWFWELPRARAEMQRIEAIRGIDAAKIARIVVFDDEGRRKIAEFHARPVLDEFADACRDIQGYAPSHPRYERSWAVRIEGAEPFELVCHFRVGTADQVFGEILGDKGLRDAREGQFRSVALRGWFEKHVVPADKGPP